MIDLNSYAINTNSLQTFTEHLTNTKRTIVHLQLDQELTCHAENLLIVARPATFLSLCQVTDSQYRVGTPQVAAERHYSSLNRRQFLPHGAIQFYIFDRQVKWSVQPE